MTSERVRGAVLYGCAAALLAAGVTWWLLAAPASSGSPVERWSRAAEEILPDEAGPQDAGTVPLDAGAEHVVVLQPPPSEYWVRVVCVGDPGTRVRVSLGAPGSDSGRGLACGPGSEPTEFRVSTVSDLQLNVTVTELGPVVFRYALAPT